MPSGSEAMDWLKARGALLVLALLAGWLALDQWSMRARSRPPGVLASEEPVQTSAEGQAAWTFKGSRIEPLARFSLRARVLSTERYRFDDSSFLSPVDFALGWGPMSDSRVLDQLSIGQGNRWYTWSCEQFPIPRREIETHSANMHLIPASAAVKSRLLSVRTGDLVHLDGYLVRCQGPNGFHWQSSLTREDTGDGSCEVVWVDSASEED
jgi:hypothetical protein